MLHRCTKRKSLLPDNIFNLMIQIKIEIKLIGNLNNHISMKQ